METSVRAERGGVVGSILVSPGSHVDTKDFAFDSELVRPSATLWHGSATRQIIAKLPAFIRRDPVRRCPRDLHRAAARHHAPIRNKLDVRNVAVSVGVGPASDVPLLVEYEQGSRWLVRLDTH